MTRIRWNGMDTKRVIKFMIILMVLILVGTAIAEWLQNLQTTFTSYTNG